MIPDELVEEVKALRSAIGKNGKPLSIPRICRKTKLKERQVKYILFEKDNIRIKELKQSYYLNSRKSEFAVVSPLSIPESPRVHPI